MDCTLFEREIMLKKKMCHKSEIKFVQMFQEKMIIHKMFFQKHTKKFWYVLFIIASSCSDELCGPQVTCYYVQGKPLYVGHCTCIQLFYLIIPYCFLQVDCPDLYRGRHKDDANPSLKYAQEVHSAIKKAKEKGRSVSPTAFSFAPEFN